MSGELLVTLVFAFLALLILKKTAVVVPQQSAYVVERLGKYSSTLNAGLHILIPFLDVIRYRHSLKEIALDVPEQICITKDNVQVGVDGVLYIKVLLNGNDVLAMVDTGATHNFVAERMVQTRWVRIQARLRMSIRQPNQCWVWPIVCT